MPSKKTADTERAAERLMEAIEVYQGYLEELSIHRVSKYFQPERDSTLLSSILLQTYIFRSEDVSLHDSFLFIRLYTFLG